MTHTSAKATQKRRPKSFGSRRKPDLDYMPLNEVDRTAGQENNVTQLGFGFPDKDLKPELANIFVLSTNVADFLIDKLGKRITTSLHLLLPKNYVKVKTTIFKAAQSRTVESETKHMRPRLLSHAKESHTASGQ